MKSTWHRSYELIRNVVHMIWTYAKHIKDANHMGWFETWIWRVICDITIYCFDISNGLFTFFRENTSSRRSNYFQFDWTFGKLKRISKNAYQQTITQFTIKCHFKWKICTRFVSGKILASWLCFFVEISQHEFFS